MQYRHSLKQQSRNSIQIHGDVLKQESPNICLKTFVIFVIFLGALSLVTGVLALLASQGSLPSGINSISNLTRIGIVNSSLMIGGGIIIFLMGVAAWTCHLHRTRVVQL